MADDRATAVCLNQPESVVNDRDFELANELTFDFYCLRFWEEFKEKSTVDQQSDRNLLQGLLSQRFTYTTQRENLVHFMQMIVCLADGQDAATKYSVNPGEEDTPLEKALSLLDELVAEYEDLGEEVETVRDALKIQAVMVCMKADDYGQAKMVHQRVWGKSGKPSHSRQRAIQSALKCSIDDKKVPQSFLDRHNYESFLQIAKVLLQKVYNRYNTPFLLKVVQAYKRRRLQALENDTEDVSSVEVPSSKPASETSSPLKGFRRSERLSDELNSQPVTTNEDVSAGGEYSTQEGLAVKRGRHNNPAHVAIVDGDKDGCHVNNNHKDIEKVNRASSKTHGNHSLDTDNVDYGNHRTECRTKGKSGKRKRPVVSSDSEEENADSCQETNKTVAKTTSPSHNGDGIFTNGEFFNNLQTFKAVLQSLVGTTDVIEVTSKPLVLPEKLKRQHNLRSRGRAQTTTPSMLKSPPTKTSTPAPAPMPTPTKKSTGRVQPEPSSAKTSTQAPRPGLVQPNRSPAKMSTPAPSPGRLHLTPSPTKTTPATAPSRTENTPQDRTSDGREHSSPNRKSEGSFIKFQKTTPRRGKSIRNQKYQPNRVKETGPDVPSTSNCHKSPYSFSDDDSNISDSPPILHSPRVRRSLDPDTWNGNAGLRKLPGRRKNWTEEEVDLLKQALRRYGPGKWSDMILNYDFNGRTNVNLKDKWRTMVKNGEI